MSLVLTLAGKIPQDLFVPVKLTPKDLESSARRGLLHRLLVTADIWLGQYGSTVPDTTISSRTALTLITWRMSVVTARDGIYIHAFSYEHAPLWALALGAALEWVDPGHLQQALIGDAARAVCALGYLCPTLAPRVEP